MTISVFDSAVKMGDAIGNGEITSRALWDLMKAQRAAHNGVLNAIVAEPASTTIYAACDAADARVIAGTRKSRLDGVPFTLKMALATQGLMTSNVNGTNYSASAPKNSDIAGKLLAAGGILTGKTNMGSSPVRTVSTGNPPPSGTGFGTTKHPYNTNYVNCGSAGGSACAVAAGMTAYDIAIDSAGSIRIPAATSGVVGFAPTNGLVSGYGDWTTDMPSMPPSDMFDLNTYGPICRDLDDAAEILKIISGPTMQRPSTRLLVPSTNPALYKIKSIRQIGVWTCNFQSQIDAILAAQSCIVDTSSPTVTWFDETAFNNIYNGLANDTAQLPLWFASNFGRTTSPYYASQIPYSSSFSSKTYQAKAHAVWLSVLMAGLFGDVDQTFGDVDVLAMGTVALSPPLFTGTDPASIAYMAFTALANDICRFPCVTMRVGTDAATGLPIGMQLVARPGRDLDLISYAKNITGLPGFVPPSL